MGGKIPFPWSNTRYNNTKNQTYCRRKVWQSNQLGGKSEGGGTELGKLINLKEADHGF